MALQAELYQEQFNLPLEEFIESARKRMSDPELIHLLS
jgi:hypothetical protein